MTAENPAEQSNRRALLKPGRVLFIAALLYLGLGAGAFFFQRMFLVWFLAGLGGVPFVVIDALMLLFLCDRLHIEREIPRSLAEGREAAVTLIIRRASRLLLPSSILLYDRHPVSMRSQAFPARLNRRLFKNSAHIRFEYTLLARERGPWFFTGTDVLLASPLRLWRLQRTHAVTGAGRTYPDFKKIAGGPPVRGPALHGEAREIRKRGQGMEFESLRDYQDGDSIRAIDWRATSRSLRPDGRLKLIVRNYQEERDQQILFIIDCGYRLPGVQFDSALNALLLLSYTALKHGDRVAAASFGAEERWIPPRKGASALTGMINGLYDLHSAPVPSSPFSALENALSRLHRRSFIILISNFREEDGESLAWILPRIERRHLLLLVSFRESETEALAFPTAAQAEAAGPAETLERAAAFSCLAARRRLYKKWEHSGLLVLETTPEHISAEMINRYLAVKRSGRL
jgi:uncharacterized protein (DUF58 family)